MLKSWWMCRFLPPTGRQQNRGGNLRYLVFFEILKFLEKDAKNWNVKILMDVSLFAASRTATKSGRESPLPCVFWDSQFFWKKMQKIETLKSWWMCRFLPPPGRQQNRSGNLRYLVFFEIRNFLKKDANSWNVKILKDVSLFAASGTVTKSDPESPLPCVFWNSQNFEKRYQKWKC